MEDVNITPEEELTNPVFVGNKTIDGNLTVTGQVSAEILKVTENNSIVMSSSGDTISFRKACSFSKPVEFVGGTTISTVPEWGATVNSTTIKAGENIVLGNSYLKMSSSGRKIVADTFTMILQYLEVDNVVSKKEVSDLITAKNVKVTGELVGSTVWADTLQSNKLYFKNIAGLNLVTQNMISTKDLDVSGSALIQGDITIQGTGVEGAAVTVNGGELVANKGIVSHTRNNRFQTMQIMGSGTNHDICFKIDKGVDSVIEGDVTIQDSKLILDNSALVTDQIVVTPMSSTRADSAVNGVTITTSPTWDTYVQEMVETLPPEQSLTPEDSYDPVAVENEAIERNAANYERIHENVKSIVNPISYCMEQRDGNIPKKFNVKDGIYRIDHTGNALMKNIVSEKGTFSQLDAYKFNVNRLDVDKLVTTSVASNVVHTYNLMKSDGIAEFNGSMNVKADVFFENGSKIYVDDGSKLTFQDGSELKLTNGAKFEMGTNTTVKMSGDIELDLAKLVFFDSNTNRRYRISFRDAHCGEGMGVVMDYERVEESPRASDEIVE